MYKIYIIFYLSYFKLMSYFLLLSKLTNLVCCPQPLKININLIVHVNISSHFVGTLLISN